jgi:hypothetical protein
LTACLLTGLCALSAAAQAKPDFSGTWKMNPAKSNSSAAAPMHHHQIRAERRRH